MDILEFLAIFIQILYKYSLTTDTYGKQPVACTYAMHKNCSLDACLHFHGSSPINWSKGVMRCATIVMRRMGYNQAVVFMYSRSTLGVSFSSPLIE